MATITRRDMFVAAAIVGIISGLAGGIATTWTVERIVPPIVAPIVIDSVDKATRVAAPGQQAVAKRTANSALTTR